MYKEFKRVRFNNDFTIDVMFWSGEFKKFDMKKYIENFPPAKLLLGNVELFKYPERIDSCVIFWNDQIDLCLDWIYRDGINISPFEDGIEIPLPQIENRMRMKRARFNDDFSIEVMFEDGNAKRYNMLDNREDFLRIWSDSEEERLNIFKHPDNFTQRFIHWNNGDECEAEYIYENGKSISVFDEGIEPEY